MKSDMKTVNRLANLIDEVATAAIYLEYGEQNGLDPEKAAIVHNEAVKAVYNALLETVAEKPECYCNRHCEVCQGDGWFDPYMCGYQITCPCAEDRCGHCPLRKND